MTAPTRTALLVVGIAWGAIAACLIILKHEPASPVLAPASSSPVTSSRVELDVTTAPPAAPPTSTPEAWAVAGVQADRLDMVAVGVPPVPPPVDGQCETWRPLLDKYGIPYDEALPVMRRESQCSMAHNYNPRTRDDSWGPFQVNRWGSLAAWWDEGGYTADVMATPEGSVAAASVLYHSCRWAPWVKPYGCDGDYLTTPEPKWGSNE